MRFLLIILCLYPFKIFADIHLDCESTSWRMNSPYTQKWGESWVPQKHSHIIKNNNSTFIRYGRNFVQTSKVQETNDRIVIKYKKKTNQNYQNLNLIFFKTNNKFSIEIGVPGGYISPGDVWGTCKTSTLNAQNTNQQDNSQIVKFVKTNKRIYGNPSQVLYEANELAKDAKKISQSFKNTLSKSRTNILSKPSNKAVFGALPRSCNYRYTTWNKPSPISAIKSAKDGCNLKIKKYNKLMNKNCQCSLFALNDVIFVDADFFIGEVGYVPIRAEIQENDQKIIIKGTVEFKSPGNSISNFDLINNKGNKICKGYFNIKDKAKGSIFLDCFEGKYKGKGSFVNSGFDVERRFMNGTALINLNDNAIMRVVYGTDAL